MRSEKIVFIIRVLIFNIRGKLRNPIFGNILIALYKEFFFIDFEIGKIVFIIKGLILLIEIPNNKYHPNTKNYLPCLLLGGFSITEKGSYIYIYVYLLISKSKEV